MILQILFFKNLDKIIAYKFALGDALWTTVGFMFLIKFFILKIMLSLLTEILL